MKLVALKAPLSHKMEVLVKMPPPDLPRSMHDVRVEALRHGLEGALHEVAELDVMEKLLEDQWWSGSIREDIINVVELG